MVHLEDRFMRDPDIVQRFVKRELILVPIRARKGREAEFYVLEEVGNRVWELLDGNRKCREVIEGITSEFRVNRKRAGREVLLFLKSLQEERLIRRAS